MADIKEIIQKQRAYYDSGVTRQIPFRIDKLKTLRKAITESEEEVLEALKKDLNKAPFEAYATEVGITLDELRHAIRHLPAWARSKRVRTPVMHFPSRSYIVSEPHGIALIISPWNYPFQLALAPLIGSISGGNCTVIKPSEYSPNISSIIAKIVREYFDEQFIAVVEGGKEASEELLTQKYDYIFFTGSVQVGKVIMEAASKNLTPVTLELGGKSPCIVDRESSIDLAARRIVWGKFLNAGQTCVAPDYLLVHADVKNELLEGIGKYISGFYGDDPFSSSDFPKIVNKRHFERLRNLMGSGRIVCGGKVDENSLQIAPTVIDNVTWNDPIMQEEIFGPLLPILVYNDLAEVIETVNSRPKPLALYLFTNNKETEKRIISSISFGGGCINDTIMHLATPHMPFGGVGESGMGGYHGKSSFDTFTHNKSILKKSTLIDMKFRYPPYGDKLNLLKKVLR